MKTLIVILAALAVVLTATSAMAQPATNSIDISASVAASCSITGVTNITFGSYDTTSGTPLDADGDVTFRCTKGTSYDVWVSGTRSMTTTDTLTFELYSDAPRTSTFASADPGEAGGPTANNSPQTMDIYGRIPALQDVQVDSYSTTLTVNVDW